MFLACREVEHVDVAKAFNIVTRAKRYDMMESCSEIHRTEPAACPL